MIKETNFQKVIKVLSDLPVTITGIIGILLMIFGSAYAPFGYILLFNSFDILGYSKVLRNEEDIKDVETAAYRIMQFLFQLSLLTILLLCYNYIYVISAVVMHLFGLQDLLYYLVIGEELPEENIHWLRWTPYGAIKHYIFKQDLNKIEFIIQAVIGTIISATITIFQAM